jgi:hypothetical protein
MIKLSKQKLLVWFLAFTLLGVQAVQNSPIHDHIEHQIDCVLCHFDSHDQGIVTQTSTKPFEAKLIYFSVFAEQGYFSSHYPSYQGRSPPHFYS